MAQGEALTRPQQRLREGMRGFLKVLQRHQGMKIQPQTMVQVEAVVTPPQQKLQTILVGPLSSRDRQEGTLIEEMIEARWHHANNLPHQALIKGREEVGTKAVVVEVPLLPNKDNRRAAHQYRTAVVLKEEETALANLIRDSRKAEEVEEEIKA